MENAISGEDGGLSSQIFSAEAGQFYNFRILQTHQNKIAGNGHGTKSDLFFNKKIGLIVFIQGHFFLHQDKNVKT